jgi:hypothetical protein
LTATSETWDDHWQQIEDAKARGDFFDIVSPVWRGDRPHHNKGLAYCDSLFAAGLVEASRLPSERGNGNRLAEVLKGAMGNAAGPVAHDNAERDTFNNTLVWQSRTLRHWLQ